MEALEVMKVSTPQEKKEGLELSKREGTARRGGVGQEGFVEEARTPTLPGRGAHGKPASRAQFASLCPSLAWIQAAYQSPAMSSRAGIAV
jgi:hypothetical protein